MRIVMNWVFAILMAFIVAEGVAGAAPNCKGVGNCGANQKIVQVPGFEGNLRRELAAKMSDTIRATLPRAVLRIVDSKQLTANQVAAIDATDECPEPSFSMTFTKAECKTHSADHCDEWNPFEGNCDPGFSDGAAVVEPQHSAYSVHWTANNAFVVLDSCHEYREFTEDFASSKGDVDWTWDGPDPSFPGESEWPQGFHALLNRMIRDALDPISDAMAIKISYTNHRTPGTFNCKAYVLGKCWKVKEIDYTYSCHGPSKAYGYASQETDYHGD